MDSIYHRYLKILNAPKKNPSLEYLKELLTSHIIRIPFENISKLYYSTKGLKTIPDFDLYLNGIEQNNFGGTCYSNNYYFNLLLKSLGFNAWLCGADMSLPDVHMVNVVLLEDKKYLADVGYGAPFFNPIPLDLNNDYKFSFGNEDYVLHPKNNYGYSELEQFRENKIKHGYFVKSIPRSIIEFEGVIKDLFKDSAQFLNRVTIIKFALTSSISIRNHSLITVNKKNVKKIQLTNKEQIVENIVTYFSIPFNIVNESINSIKYL